MITAGALPFDEPNLGLLFKKIQKADYQTPAWFSKELAHLLHAIITPDPRDRQGALHAGPLYLLMSSPIALWRCSDRANALATQVRYFAELAMCCSVQLIDGLVCQPLVCVSA